MMTLSALSHRFDQFYGIRVGEASHPGPVDTITLDLTQKLITRLWEVRPVAFVCPCNAHCFVAQIDFAEAIESNEDFTVVKV